MAAAMEMWDQVSKLRGSGVCNRTSDGKGDQHDEGDGPHREAATYFEMDDGVSPRKGHKKKSALKNPCDRDGHMKNRRGGVAIGSRPPC